MLQYANSLKQLILYLHLWKNIFSSLSPAYWTYKPGLFFSWQIKMSNLLHVGLILIISKVFTILCLLCLCRNKEFSGNFQNKTVISKLIFQMSAQVKCEGRSFWSGQEAYIYPLNYLLPTYTGNVNYYKSVDHPNPFNWVSRYFLFLPNLKGKQRPFLEGCKKGDHIARLSLGWYKRWKSISFYEIWNNPTFLLDPLTNKHCRAWSSMINLWIDSRTSQK